MAYFSPTPLQMPNGGNMWFGDAPPALSTDGTYQAGDYMFVTLAAASAPALYKCTIGGAPGTWVTPIDSPLSVLAASGAVNPHIPQNYIVTKAGVAALTLAAPTVTVDDGVIIVLSSNTANAHTLTATGLFQCGTASVNLATFAAQAGAGLTIMAYQGKWNVLGAVGITFS